MAGTVVITSTFLQAGDEVDRRLRASGLDVVHAPPSERARRGNTLAATIADADAVIAGTDVFDAATIDGASRLKLIVRTGVGYDNVDVEAAARRGITVCTTPGANRRSVAELVLGLMLNAARGIPANIVGVRTGRWEQPSGRELSGSTLGLIGLGSIGKTVAELALAFGMRVVATDPFIDREFLHRTGVRETSLTEILAVSDFVSCHLFLDESTHHLLDADRLSGMKATAFLINTSRGAVIDEHALAAALGAGRLAGAALDVLEEEPLSPENPLASIATVSITSHIAGATVEARLRSGLMAADAVITSLAGGQPTGVVSLETASAD